MKYPKEIDEILKKQLTELIDKVRKKEQFLNVELIENYHNIYKMIKKQKNILK